MQESSRVIAVDFDDTLVGQNADGTPYVLPGAAEALSALRARGAYIIIHTCRMTIARADGSLDHEIEYVEQLLADFAIPFDEIYVGDKMVADLYIDDRAVGFRGDWTATLAQALSRLK